MDLKMSQNEILYSMKMNYFKHRRYRHRQFSLNYFWGDSLISSTVLVDRNYTSFIRVYKSKFIWIDNAWPESDFNFILLNTANIHKFVLFKNNDKNCERKHANLKFNFVVPDLWQECRRQIIVLIEISDFIRCLFKPSSYLLG